MDAMESEKHIGISVKKEKGKEKEEKEEVGGSGEVGLLKGGEYVIGGRGQFMSDITVHGSNVMDPLAGPLYHAVFGKGTIVWNSIVHCFIDDDDSTMAEYH
jgi:hypothetical protein